MPFWTEYIRDLEFADQLTAISLLSEKDYDNFRRVLDNPSLKVEKLPLPKFEILHFQAFLPRKFVGNYKPQAFRQQRRFQQRPQGR